MWRMHTPIIQVTNVAPTATRDQMKTLFSFIGKIEELKLYPSEDIPVPVKVCFVRFEDSNTAGVALHLTNTVFIDRALNIGPYTESTIPDEGLGLQISLQAATGTLPGSSSTWPSNVVSKMQGFGTNQIISTNDPKLTALGLPQYPPLPANTDPTKIEEIRRTIFVGNLDSTVKAEQILNYFTQAGEVKYVRMAGDDTHLVRFAFVEFSDQRSIPSALTYNSVMFAGRPLKVNHSNNAIVKPLVKPEAAQREIDEAMKKVKEAQSLISAAIDTGKDRSSRSRSRSRKHRSRSRSRKSPLRSQRRSRSRKRSKSKKRSRSRGRRSRSRKRSRSRSKTLRRPSKSSRKTPPRAYSRRKSRSTSKSKPLEAAGQTLTPRPNAPIERSRKRRSRSRTRKHRSKSVEKKKLTSKSPSPPKLKKEGSPTSSPEKEVNRDATKPELTAESDKDSISKPPAEVEPKEESKPPAEVEPKEESKPPAEVEPKEESKPPAEVEPKEESKPPAEVEPKEESKEKEVDSKVKSSSPARKSRSRSPSTSRSSKRARRSPSPRKQSPSPRKRSPSPRKRSPSPRKRSASPRKRSASPRKRSRSRSGSRHRQSSRLDRSKKRKDRERSRDRRSDRDREKDRDRDRDHDSKSKKRHRDKDRSEHKEEKGDVKVKRDYDEEEKGYTSPNRQGDGKSNNKVLDSPRADKPDTSPVRKNGNSSLVDDNREYGPEVKREADLPEEGGARETELQSDDMDTSD